MTASCVGLAEPNVRYGAAFVSRVGGHDRGEDVWKSIRSAYAPRS